MTGRPAAPNDLGLLLAVVERLEAGGSSIVVFGGWAEELLELTPPRPHWDIDLLTPAASFAAIDRLLADRAGGLREVTLKRFAHKRAFLVGDVMVEITLVEQDDGGPVTRFWGEVPFRWLRPLACSQPVSGERRLSMATPENLARYRSLHRTTQP